MARPRKNAVAKKEITAPAVENRQHDVVAQKESATEQKHEEANEREKASIARQDANTIASLERKVLSSVITGNSWDRVCKILKDYKWSNRTNAILAEAVNMLFSEHKYVNTNSVQNVVSKLHPEDSVKVTDCTNYIIAPSLLIPIANKIVELSK